MDGKINVNYVQLPFNTSLEENINIVEVKRLNKLV